MRCELEPTQEQHVVKLAAIGIIDLIGNLVDPEAVFEAANTIREQRVKTALQMTSPFRY